VDVSGPVAVAERHGLVDKRVVELANARARGEAEPDAKGLAPRPARAQPAGGGAADAPLDLVALSAA
jgi:hypothetical protein